MSDDLARADRVIPGACFGYTRMPEELMFTASHGRGSRLWSTTGREYLDYTLGSGPLVIGHAHPAVVNAVAEQASRGSHFYAVNEQAVALAERITESIDSVDAVKFCADGSQATFFAMRLARAATGRRLVLKFSGAYHGHHDYALPGFPGAPDEIGLVDYAHHGTPSAVAETVLVAPFNDVAETTRLVRQYADDIAAIVVEPVQRAIEPRDRFLQALRTLCDSIGSLLIFDEVVTGFRLARGGAQQVYDVRPDLTALGKAVGGGLPLGVVGGSRAVIEQVVPQAPGEVQKVFMSGTLNGNPLSAAAGLATLTVLDEVGGPDRLAKHGRVIADGLRDIIATRGIQAHVMGPDAFIEVIFGGGDVYDHASYAATDRAAATAFGIELNARGIYCVPGTKLYISTEHDDGDAELFLTHADEALAALAHRGLVPS